MRRLVLVVGVLGAVAFVNGASNVARATPPAACAVTMCGTEHGNVTESCVETLVEGEIIDQPGTGGGAGLDPGECETLKAKGPCEEIPECRLLFATRQTPALGASALLIVAFGLGTGGISHLRRRRARPSS